MIRRITGSVDDTQGGIDELVVIEEEAQSRDCDQDAEQHTEVSGGITADRHFLLLAEAQQSGHHIHEQHDDECQRRQHHDAVLHEGVERQSKQVEPKVDPEQRIGDSDGFPVTESQVRIPMSIEPDRKQQGDRGTGEPGGRVQEPGRQLHEAEQHIGRARRCGRLAAPPAGQKRRLVPAGLANIDP